MNLAPLGNTDKLCVHTITTRPWSMEEIIDKYPAAGVHGITVWRNMLEGGSPSKIGDSIRAAGMDVVSVARGGFFPATQAAKREDAIEENKRAIDDAAGLGAPVLVLVCGAAPGLAITESLKQIEAGIEAVLPYAESANVKLAVEPLHPMYADTRSAVCNMLTANTLVEQLQSPYLGVAVDVFHVWWDPDLQSQIERCGENGNIFACHVCDWKTDMADMLNDRGLMGEGVINIREIRGWLESAGFDGYHEVEIFSDIWWKRDQDEFLAAINAAYLEHV